MKNLSRVLASVGTLCLIAGTAVSAEEQKLEAYAHPTLFGSSAQTQTYATADYVVGGKITKACNRAGMVNKDNVLVNAWAKDVLSTIKNNTTQTDFNVKAPVLRSELAVILAEGLSISKTTNTAYTDLAANHWAKSWIDRATAQGVMIGYPDNTFKADQPVTKAEVFATLATLIDVKTDRSLIVPSFDGKTIQYIPRWAIAPTKEIVESTLLNSVPDSSKVVNDEYLSKEQVAYLVGALRQNYLLKSSSANCACANATPVVLNVKLTERLSAKVSNVGDKFIAKTTADTTLNGTAFPAGSTVRGEVVEVSRPGIDNPGYIKVKFTEIENDGCVLAFPEKLSSATATNLKNPNVIARLLGAPLSAAARVTGVAGRSVGAIVDVAANGLEQYGDNLSNTLVNLTSLQPVASARSFGGSFITVGKGIFDITKVVASGTFGVLYEFVDEVKYLILPSASNDSSLNPGEELTIVY